MKEAAQKQDTKAGSQPDPSEVINRCRTFVGDDFWKKHGPKVEQALLRALVSLEQVEPQEQPREADTKVIPPGVKEVLGEVTGLRLKAKNLDNDLKAARSNIETLKNESNGLRAKCGILAEPLRVLEKLVYDLDDLWKRLGPSEAGFYMKNLQRWTVEANRVVKWHQAEIRAALSYPPPYVRSQASMGSTCSVLVGPDGSCCPNAAGLGVAGDTICLKHVQGYINEIAGALGIEPMAFRVLDAMFQLAGDPEVRKRWKEVVGCSKDKDQRQTAG